MREVRVTRDTDGFWVGKFDAMASPCEVLLEVSQESAAQRIAAAVAHETWRIENKFSRYRDDNIVAAINRNAAVEVDDETAQLLDFADRCHKLSGGRFDVTSGVLRNVWRFDGSDRVPDRDSVSALLPRIGWDKVCWQRPFVTVPAGMEIDLGGFGKEYAVDRGATIVRNESVGGAVVNFGGDLHVTGPRSNGTGWNVGVEDPGGPGRSRKRLSVRFGAIATSGDSRRYLLKDGKRYSHVLDPTTGWPVDNAPRSVSVLAGSCTEAGLLATVALLQGANAEAFLEAQGVRFWCMR